MLLALLLIPGGILIMVYAKKVVDFTGKVEFAENWFGYGGTYTFVKLVGLAITILSFMYLVGGLDSFIEGTVGRLIPGGM